LGMVSIRLNWLWFFNGETNQLLGLLAPINFGKQIAWADAERGGDAIQLDQINAQRTVFDFGNSAARGVIPARELQLVSERILRPTASVATPSADQSAYEIPLLHWFKCFILLPVFCPVFWTKWQFGSIFHATSFPLSRIRDKIILPCHCFIKCRPRCSYYEQSFAAHFLIRFRVSCSILEQNDFRLASTAIIRDGIFANCEHAVVQSIAQLFAALSHVASFDLFHFETKFCSRFYRNSAFRLCGNRTGFQNCGIKTSVQ